MRNCLAADILVDQVESKSGPGTLQLGHPGGDLFDGVNLLVQEVRLKEIAKMRVAICSLVHVQETLVDGFLQLKGSLHGLQGSPPLHGGGLGDVLEDNSSSSSVLVLDELLGVVSLLVGVLLEEGVEAAVGDVIPVEVVSQGHVDVAGVQLLVVLSDAGSHVVVVVVVVYGCVCCTLSGVAAT